MNTALNIHSVDRDRLPSAKTIWQALPLPFALVWLLSWPMAVGSLADDATPDNAPVALRPDAGSPPEPPTAAAKRGSAAESPAKAAAEIATEEEASEDEALPGRFFARGDAQSPHRVRQLSVPPETKPLLPADRPAWVGAAPELTGNNHRLFVGSYPTATPEEADRALDGPLVAAVNGYLEETVLKGTGTRRLHLTADFVRKNLVDHATEYMAELSTSLGPMYQKWVVLRITPEHRKHFRDMHRGLEQQKRLVALGLGVMSLIGVTGAAHLILNRRRRRYSGAAPSPVTAFVHEEALQVAPVAKPRRRGRKWLLALGGVGLVCLLGNLSVTDVRRASVRNTPAVVEHIHTYPPLPEVELEFPPMPEAPGHAPRRPRLRHRQVDDTIESRSYLVD